jgi:hypothetical protein
VCVCGWCTYSCRLHLPQECFVHECCISCVCDAHVRCTCVYCIYVCDARVCVEHVCDVPVFASKGEEYGLQSGGFSVFQHGVYGLRVRYGVNRTALIIRENYKITYKIV